MPEEKKVRANQVLVVWQRLSRWPGGKWLFSRFVCLRAPYFASIRPLFVALRPGRSEVFVRNRHQVHNHIGTVHAIALCNMAELAAGTLCEASTPASHRWIPKGMSVEYLHKATSDMRAIARVDPLPTFGAAFEMPVPVEVRDTSDVVVCRVVVSMWVTPKRPDVARTD